MLVAVAHIIEIICMSGSRAPAGTQLTIIIISSLFTPVRDETLTPLNRPLAMGPRSFTVRSIRPNTHTDNDIAFRFLGLRATLSSLRGTRIIHVLKRSSTRRTGSLSRGTSAMTRRSLWITRISENGLSIRASIQ